MGNLNTSSIIPVKLASDPVTDLVEGRIYYNTTSKRLRYYNGTSWADAGTGAGADFQLSNLSGTTAVPVALLPATDIATDIGSATKRWLNIWGSVGSFTSQVGLRDTSGNPILNASITSYQGYNGPYFASPSDNVTYPAYGFRGRALSSGTTSHLILGTGNASGASNDSGDIIAITGTVSAGTRGQFSITARQVNVNSTKIVNVSDPSSAQDAATKNYVDNNTANKTLSNLTNPTSIPANLIPTTTDTYILGTSGKIWNSISVKLIHDGTQNAMTLTPSARNLHNTSGTVIASFAGTSLDLQNNLITNLLDPVDDQDAATKIYVDTAVTRSWNTSLKSGTYTAVDKDELFVDTTSAAVTITLPAFASSGTRVRMIDYAGTWATNNVTVDRNGLKINGGTSNYTLNVNNSWVDFVYIDSTKGWRTLL